MGWYLAMWPYRSLLLADKAIMLQNSDAYYLVAPAMIFKFGFPTLATTSYYYHIVYTVFQLNVLQVPQLRLLINQRNCY